MACRSQRFAVAAGSFVAAAEEDRVAGARRPGGGGHREAGLLFGGEDDVAGAAAEELVAQGRDRGGEAGRARRLRPASCADPSGAAAAPIAKACALSVALLPWGSSASRACAVGSGRSPPAETSSGARTGAAISTEAAIAPCQSSSSTSVTAVGRCATLAEGKTASATPAAVVAGSEPPTRVVLLVAKEG